VNLLVYYMNVYVFSSKEIPLMPSHMGNIPVIGYMVKCSTQNWT